MLELGPTETSVDLDTRTAIVFDNLVDPDNGTINVAQWFTASGTPFITARRDDN